MKYCLILTTIIFSILSNGCSDQTPPYGKNGMVVSTSRHASQVGIDILQKNGNAVDAVSYTHLTLPTIYSV